MSMENTQNIFDASILVDKLPGTGRHLKINVTGEDLNKLAQIAKVSSVGRFSALLKIVRIDGGVHVTGQLKAEVTQPCVVTLEPVHQQIDENLDRVFLPMPADGVENAPGSETYIEFTDEDIPDYYEGNSLDLSAFLIEALGLSIDLYPRRAGAKMSEKQSGDDPRDLSPFAVLKSVELKD